MSEFKAAVAGESEAQWRQFLSYLFAQSSAGLATPGVLAGLSVTQTTTASASVLVNIGAVVTQSSLTAGADPLLNNGQKTVDVLTANPLGGVKRNDLVVFDPATSSVSLVVGTPNAVPTDPAVPTGAVPLARLRHDPAVSSTTVPTSQIDDLRVFTSLFGVDDGDASPTSLTLATGWGSVSGYRTASYRNRPYRSVVLSGAAKRTGANVGTLAPGNTLLWAAPLPAAVRPTTPVVETVDSTSGPVRLVIGTDGSLTLVPILSSITVNTGWSVWVDGVAWDLL